MKTLCCAALFCLLSGCAVKTPMTNQYQLTAFDSSRVAMKSSHHTVLVTPPEAMAGYQTEQMQYITQRYSLKSFAKNSWFSSPANMIYPLIVQSLQRSGYFYAVGSGNYPSKTDYRLDTQLLELQQNYLHKPSVVELKLKAILTRVSDNQILGSQTFTEVIPCTNDTPYGGVMAANNATALMTKQLSQFVIDQIKAQ